MRGWIVAGCGLLAAGAMAVGAQVGLVAKPSAEYHSNQSLEEKGAALLAQAAKSGGIASQPFETYAGSVTSMTARTASGGGELHKRLDDNFFAVSGEATEITGGHLVDGKDTTPDEVRGTRVEGGDAHVLHKGDVLHILANTPHQTIVAPGKTFVYYVVKVGEPPARMMPASR